MTNIENEIIEDVRELLKLEREYNKYTYETRRPENKEETISYFTTILSKASEAYKLRHKIIFNSQETDIIKLYDNNVITALNDIRENKDKFYSVAAYINLLELLDINSENNNQIPINLYDQLLADDDLIMKFHSWFDITRYYIRRIKVGPIIYTSNLPVNVEKYFYEVRQSYAFGLYRSSVIMCRSIVEITLFNKLKRKKLITDVKSNVTNMRNYLDDKLVDLIRIARNNHIIDKQLSDLSYNIKKAANSVVHLKDDDIKLTEDEVLKIIKDTVKVVEHLYK